MTPKQALKKIQEVIPSVTKLIRLSHIDQPEVFGIGPDSDVDWAGTTEYQEPEYREPNLLDCKEGIEVEVFCRDSADWTLMILRGVRFWPDGTCVWICEDSRGTYRDYHKARIAV